MLNNSILLFCKVSIFLFFCIPIQVFSINEDEIITQIGALDWQTEIGSYGLEDSNVTITTSAGEYMLEGVEAHKYMRILEGHDGFKPDALLLRIDGDNVDSQIMYTYSEIGFVKMDDWEKEIDKDAILKQVKLSTEEANKIRDEGYPDMFVEGWVQEPFLDKDKAIIYWAIKARSSDDASTINAKAIKLGRKGYAEVLWTGAPELFVTAQEALGPAIEAYAYNDGYAYKDFVPGTDKVAAVGAGALAYKIITGNLAAKTGLGLLGVLLVFLKKFWFLLGIPLFWVWKKFKGKRTDETTS